MGTGMNIDNKGLSYYDESSKGEEIVFSLDKLIIRSKFYELLDNPNYIIKKTKVDNIDSLLNMLLRFNEVNDSIHKTDLPINYYMENDTVNGMIIPYYKDSITLYSLSKTYELKNLMKYYYHDDDMLHNLYLLYNDIIDVIEELYENGICYYDSNATNFVFKDNKVHLIDFDYKYLSFNINNRNKHTTVDGLYGLIDKMNGRFLLRNDLIHIFNSFDSLRKYLVKKENKIRKYDYNSKKRFYSL